MESSGCLTRVLRGRAEARRHQSEGPQAREEILHSRLEKQGRTMPRTSLSPSQAQRILAISNRAGAKGTARPRRSDLGEGSANPNRGEATTSADVPENTPLAGSLLRQTGTDPETFFDPERHNKEDAYESSSDASGTSDGSDEEDFRVEKAVEDPQRSLVDHRQEAEDELERQALPTYGEDDSDYTDDGEVTDDEDEDDGFFEIGEDDSSDGEMTDDDDDDDDDDDGFVEVERQRQSEGGEGTSSGKRKRVTIAEACEHVLLRCKSPYDKQGLPAGTLAGDILDILGKKVLPQSVHSALKRDDHIFEQVEVSAIVKRFRLILTDKVKRRMRELRERGENIYPTESQED